MQNSCQSCGLVFNQGPPPLEALSPTQASAVGVAYGGDPASILCPTLSNMSVYNFCSVCIIFARYDTLWGDEAKRPGHKLVQARPASRAPADHIWPSCECGHAYDPPETHRTSKLGWIWVNRAQHLHHAYNLLPFYDSLWGELGRIDLTADY